MKVLNFVWYSYPNTTYTQDETTAVCAEWEYIADSEYEVLINRFSIDAEDDIRIQNAVVSLLFFISGNHITARTKNIIKSLLKQKEEKLCA